MTHKWERTAATAEALLGLAQAIIDESPNGAAVSRARAFSQPECFATFNTVDELADLREWLLDKALRRPPILHDIFEGGPLALAVRALGHTDSRNGHWPLFVRRSASDPGMWTFYASPEHLAEGRRTATRPGRLLRRFKGRAIASQWCPDDFDRWVAEVGNAWTLEQAPPVCAWAQGADDIVRVYTNGPRSCMSHDFVDEYHPVRVYDSPDVGLAYACKGDRIVARALVNRLDDTHSTVYGNASALVPWLQQQGIHEGCGLNGCRLRYLEDEWGNITAPYVDGDYGSADVETDGSGTWLVVCENGEYGLRSTAGLVEGGSRMVCADCGARFHEDDATYLEVHEDYVCADCIGEYVEVRVRPTRWGWSDTEYRRPDDYEVVHYGGEYYLRDSLSEYDLVELDGEVLHMDDVVYLEDRDEYVKMEDAAECDECGEWFRRNDVHRHENSELDVCAGCAESLNQEAA